MEQFSLELPAMYGDHHVVEVRRILSALPGVGDIYASSSFQLVELNYDPAQITPEAIQASLGAAGYLGALLVAVEVGATQPRGTADGAFFRHSAAHAQTGRLVSFAQDIPAPGRALWPCPGLGVLKTEKEMNHA